MECGCSVVASTQETDTFLPALPKVLHWMKLQTPQSCCKATLYGCMEETHRPTWIFSVCTFANSPVESKAVKLITRSRVALEWVEEVILAAVVVLAIKEHREHVE